MTTLLMDNAAIHHANELKDIDYEKCLLPWFLPPYSPEDQPVQHSFSVAKEYVQAASNTSLTHS